MSRLNAPEGFRWTDDDVLYEKNDSLLSGIILGLVLGVLLMVIVLAAIG